MEKMMTKHNPLKAGYSRATIGKNIAHIERAGHKAVQAVAAALKAARASFRKRFPKKALPKHLRRTNPDIHIDIQSHNTKGRNVRAKNPSETFRVFVRKHPSDTWKYAGSHSKKIIAVALARYFGRAGLYAKVVK